MATVRRLLVGQAALGALAVPLLLFAGYMLEDRWGLGTSARGAVFAALAIAAAAVLVLLAREGERLLERGPEMVLRCAAAAAAIAAAALPAAALAPLFGLSVALLGAAFGALAVAWAAIVAVELTIVADGARQHAAVLGALAALGVGGIAGLLVSGDLVDDLGTTAALAVLCLPAAIAALALRAAADTAGDDLRATAAASAEERAVGQARGAGAREPLLACRGIVVSYGHRRALDGVDLEVREGELVALLGTNGAGKSTLLRVISGLTPPVAGTVRLEGRDITLADTERRFGLGIGHVAGGDSLFGSLRVAESLRLAAHMAGLRDAVQREAVGGVLQRFPQLADRTATRAAALSGGERQMLALAQMLLRPPRLLLIDELSLGLAPGVVDELLGVVREIHAAGTTVLLVEQSADLALGLATRAVFLERGRVRFDGDPQTLRRRDDLLRAVFLARA
jgi:branched-chain amino acid transport system ATP-binding protein